MRPTLDPRPPPRLVRGARRRRRPPSCPGPTSGAGSTGWSSSTTTSAPSSTARSRRRDPPVAIGVAFSMWRFWQKHGHLAEARRRLEAMEAAPWSHDDPRLRAKLEEALGGTCWWQGDLAGMTPRYREALEIWQTLDDEAELANAYYNASFTYATNVGFGPADGRCRSDRVASTSNARARPFAGFGDRRGEGNALWGLGNYRYFREIPRERRGAVPRDADDLRRGRRPDDGGVGTAHARDVAAAQRARRRGAGEHRARDPPLPCLRGCVGPDPHLRRHVCRRGRGRRPAAGGPAPGCRPQPDGRDRRGAGGLRRGHVRDRGTAGRAHPDVGRRSRPLRGRGRGAGPSTRRRPMPSRGAIRSPRTPGTRRSISA